MSSSVAAMASGALPEWAARLGAQLALYAALCATGWLVVSAVPRPKADDRSAVAQLARWVAVGADENKEDESARRGGAKGKAESEPRSVREVLACAAGLLVSFLSWGVLQEKIMVTTYASGRMDSSNFLVFSNRLAAVLVAAAILARQGELRPFKAPLYKFSLVSLSNVLSSWCQLESLKHVSFPTQVLAKSSKLIPVMLVGTLLLGRRYAAWEYGVAVTICAGAAVFMLAQDADRVAAEGMEVSMAGAWLLGLYLFFDSATSQWQSHLFRSFGVSSYQMMFGVNLFSCGFTLMALVQAGELQSSLTFLALNPDAAAHCAAFSLAAVVGQLFIYHTIQRLGPLVFTAIMTTRQVLSIVVSCLVFGHALSAGAWAGAAVVFLAVAYQTQRNSSSSSPSAKPAGKAKAKAA